MDLTIHAIERIQGRTKMQIKDVLSLINNKQTVELGSHEQWHFLLFFSLIDSSFKIAVLNRQRTILVSIWKGHYKLPGHLTVTNEHKAQARLLVTPETLEAEIHVYEDGKEEFVYPAGIISREHIFSHELAFAFLEPHFRFLASTVEAHRTKVKKIVYRIWIFNPENRANLFNYTFMHVAVRRRFET